MAFFDKLGNIASNATEMASGAIEIGKLNLKIGAEEKKVTELTTKIGAFLLTQLDAGKEYDETIMSLYREILESRALIHESKKEAATISGMVICPVCEASNPADSKFCSACGNKILAEAVSTVVAEAVPAATVTCPSCGHVEDGVVHFCTQCGTKLS